MEYQKIFLKICGDLKKSRPQGKVADYIPELGKIDGDKFGVHLVSMEDENFNYGDSNEKFSIQSISKVFSLVMASIQPGPSILDRVGVEPSGNPFNSLIQLEYEKGIPRNPFINSGALVVADFLISNLDHPNEEYLNFVRKLADNPNINYSEKITQSEKKYGFRNAALVNFMKSFGNIKNEVDEVLDFYFRLCSIEMTCHELARSFLFLVNDGTDPITQNQIIDVSTSKRINAIMQLCGFYDEAGEFSFKVGLPGKSGVGGGIVAVNPDHYSIAVWSPPLNEKGNSARGLLFLEKFTTETESSIF